jgi:hypothetical protein
MEDLSELSWATTTNKAPVGNYYQSPALRPTPPPQTSGRSTPLSAQASGAPKLSTFAPPKTSTPDSFSNLVSFGSTKKTTLSLQEQQDKLLAEKEKKEAEKRKQYETQFGAAQAWDGLGNRGLSTPTIASRSSTPALNLPRESAGPAPSAISAFSTPSNNADDELFAAFSADAPVDKSSYYPPPSGPNSGPSTAALVTNNPVDLSRPQAWEQTGSLGPDLYDDDDDPFGLGQMQPRSSAPLPLQSIGDDDDFLGDLGKPVEEVRRQKPPIPEPKDESEQESEPESDDPWDKAVAELVDMGFTAEQSRRALTESGSGLDIQAAVGWILNDAHSQAKQKQQSKGLSRNSEASVSGERRESSRNATRRENTPAWMREERDHGRPPRNESRSPNSEADFTKTAAAVGTNLFKTANSLWKTSQKKVQKAVADFQQDSDPSQPKWMKEAAERERSEMKAPSKAREHRPQVPEVTDEALMLEGDGRPPGRRGKPSTAMPEPRFPPSRADHPRDRSPAMPKPPPERERASPSPRWQQGAPPDPRSRVSKQAIEEQSAQAYVSPARRKKATPQPVQSQPEPDLLFSSAAAPVQVSHSTQSSQRPSPLNSKPSTPIPTRPKAPPRAIPSLSPTALATSSQHRLAGTAHFKRGDYASAHESYSSSLSALPSSHPITIVLLCNRALTSLKTGIPKSAVSDADMALEIIGVSRGDGEVIDLGPGEGGGSKDMKEFYGKALMRKAEALEHLERWKEAGEVWQLCVEHGVGASTAIQGRQRCEKALAPKPPPSRVVTTKAAPQAKPKSALADLGSAAGEDSAAVKRLREANIAAEKADDEKFALSDKVESKISLWRDGKRDNLRALLGSLDNVMWEGAGWKKIGMHELVQNNKVKINYMKAIGKTHPDKVCYVTSRRCVVTDNGSSCRKMQLQKSA